MLREIKPLNFGKILDYLGIHGIFLEIMGEDWVVNLKIKESFNCLRDYVF
jgi:hypothetical protein